MKRKIKDWLLVLLLLSDEVLALALVLVVLWLFKIRLSLPVVIVIALALGTFAFLTHKVIIPSFHRKKVAGSEGMIGVVGEVVEPLTPVGVIRVGGEYWKAKSLGEHVAADEYVEILGINRLTLEVRRKA